MLSLLSQVGHSLPFLRLERFFTESRCAIFTYCCFRVLSNNKKSYCNPKLASRKVIPIFYPYKAAECHLVDQNKNLEKNKDWLFIDSYFSSSLRRFFVTLVSSCVAGKITHFQMRLSRDEASFSKFGHTQWRTLPPISKNKSDGR